MTETTTPQTEPTSEERENIVWRDVARRLHQKDGEVEIDDDAKVSRADEPGAWVQAWVYVPAAKAWTGPTDSDGEPCMMINHYECTCGHTWDDQWSSSCDDDCPSCGLTISPHDTTDLDITGRPYDDDAAQEPAP